MSAQPKEAAGRAAAAERRNRLGRGLAALIGDAAAEEGLFDDRAAPGGRPADTVPVEHVRANPRNPRRNFPEAELAELARSIQEKGLLQPLIVRPSGEDGTFEIVAGERRWRAAQLARLDQVPVIVRALTDAEALEIAIIENVQRADLNPVEEATGYQRLMEEFGYTQDALSRVLGKSRSHVANTLRLAHLPDKVKQYLADGLLSAGHARAIIGADDPAALATLVVQKGLSVRETEALARGGEDAGSGGAPAGRPARVKDANTRALETDLAEALGLRVTVSHRGPGDGPGAVKIAYRSLEQLDEVCRRLMAPRPAAPEEDEAGEG